MKILEENRIQVGAYCSPQPAYELNGVKYPSKITLEHYKILADLGVTIVYGHAEAIGRENESLVFEALRLCEEVGIKYFVRDLIAERYVSLGHREFPAWKALSKEEKENLDSRFEESIKKYKDYPAFAGISFFDEPGSDSFEGIAAAKAVFERVCPDKIFYVNMLPHHISAEQLQYGACQIGVPKATDERLFTTYTNDVRYLYFTEKYIDVVKPQVYSYDSYPFLTLGNVESMIHTALYELPQICSYNERTYGVPYWMFMQIGGKWEGSANRVTTEAEMRLQISVGMAFGAKGIQLFPCCFPNDWMADPAPVAGVFGRFGELTTQYGYIKPALAQVRACGKYLAKAKSLGRFVTGEYVGLLPPEEELQKILWNETIYRGGFPENKRLDLDESLRPKTQATSQFLISAFEDESGNKMYYVVNNSIITEANIRLTLDDEETYTVVYGSETFEKLGKDLYFQRVAPGDNLLIMKKTL
ncbi:MAG: hypothetical protein E7349_06385, partial [Clostridiales bacterium]|nr:hypothetical protein [Clostridiales bacterium]